MVNNRKSIIVYAALFLFVLVIWLTSVIYWEKVKRNSKFVFTIAEISDFYHQGNVNGKEVTYYLYNKKFVDHCGSTECKRAEIGARFLVKVFEDDPEVFEIIFSFEIKKGIVAPKDGWKTFPVGARISPP
jgi:hypothetical protein